MNKSMRKYPLIAAGLSLGLTANTAVASAIESPFSLSSTSSNFDFSALGSSSNEDDGNSVSVDSNEQSGKTVNGVDLNAQEARMIELVNQHRADNGLDPITANQQLTDQARAWSKAQASEDSMSHSTDGVAENVAVNPYSATANIFFGLWEESAPHNANMLSPNITAIGYGTAINEDSGYEYATIQFFF